MYNVNHVLISRFTIVEGLMEDCLMSNKLPSYISSEGKKMKQKTKVKIMFHFDLLVLCFVCVICFVLRLFVCLFHLTRTYIDWFVLCLLVACFTSLISVLVVVVCLFHLTRTYID